MILIVCFGWVMDHDINVQVKSQTYPNQVRAQQVSSSFINRQKPQNCEKDENPHQDQIHQCCPDHLLPEEQRTPCQIQCQLDEIENPTSSTDEAGCVEV